MDFGMPTLIETDTIEECSDICKQLSLNFIELNMNLPQYQTNTMDIKKLLSLKEENNIYYTIHLDENLNIADFNDYIARAYTDTVVETILIAKKLKVHKYHLTAGVYFTLPDRKFYLFERYKSEFLSKLKSFRALCEKTIGEADIKICIENTGWYKNTHVVEGIKLLLESSLFGLTYDTGHDHSDYDGEGTDGKFIVQNQSRLCHMHLHDAKGNKLPLGKRNHLPLGSGEVDIQNKLDLAILNNCRVVLETKTKEGLLQSVEKIKTMKSLF